MQTPITTRFEHLTLDTSTWVVVNDANSGHNRAAQLCERERIAVCEKGRHICRHAGINSSSKYNECIAHTHTMNANGVDMTRAAYSLSYFGASDLLCNFCHVSASVCVS